MTLHTPCCVEVHFITPIFNKVDKCVASNYRPVSLTCVACKLLEHTLCSEIRNFSDEHSILHGFRKFLSCESQLFVTIHNLLERLDVREDVDIAILDFSKAFDVVPHRRSHPSMDLQFLIRLDPRCHVQWCTLALPGPHWWKLCSFRCLCQCNIMHWSRKSVPQKHFYTLGGEVITSVPE